MKKILIDTDTASDDAVALLMALREPSLYVLAITTVAGNVCVEKTTRNALVSIAYAGTYQPPVFQGMHKPLLREHHDAGFIHGEDGMGDLGTLKAPLAEKQPEHAVDAIIRLIRAGAGDIEIAALGPLTNLAMAILKAPKVMRKVPRVTIMGGAAFLGNANPLAEYNIWEDPEAADILFASGIPVTMVAIEACRGESMLTAQEIEHWYACGLPLAKFCMDINRSLMDLKEKDLGYRALTLPDETAIAVLARPDLVAGSFGAYTRVETRASPSALGTTVNDLRTAESHPFYAKRVGTLPQQNCTVVYQLNSRAFKDYVFSLIAGEGGQT